MAENDGNDNKNSGCMATGKHDSAGHDPDVQVTFAQNSPDQKNPLTQTPVVTAVIYAATFAATCVLYNYIGWHLFIYISAIGLPGYVIIPSVALLLTRKVRVLRNPLWLVSTAILTYIMTLVSMSEAMVHTFMPRGTPWGQLS